MKELLNFGELARIPVIAQEYLHDDPQEQFGKISLRVEHPPFLSGTRPWPIQQFGREFWNDREVGLQVLLQENGLDGFPVGTPFGTFGGQ